ncbi:pre-rRNA processing and 40S ribosomal subunit assembly [Pichia californica]|uniref:Pre-rRNA processing and 40S ribosomal subunit assembly n=1 Tax=Pichia californica TaxID=460514 RepID=A0A9P6WRD4_9ASCO|nr:pre-rRNA processing and 40S ribosomal subunit assembly [[Candida] californica]KAG0691297.1 pre-rRNA processing and 40S ribosomal subunit assembly [[Candida] californica]
MSPIVVKFEDKYSSVQKQKKPTSTEKKLRKSGKPITLAELKKKKEEALKQQVTSSGAKTAHEELKEDLDLQRLLNESHILKNLADQRRNTASGAELTLKTLNDPIIGKARVRTLDSRLQQISSINGDPNKMNKLEKMPMKMRQGMIKAQKARIEKHENEARENGIVMSINKKGSFRNIDNDKAFIAKEKLIGKSTGINKNSRYRDRGLKIQSVGRHTKNGLVLSNDDIAKIQGPQKRQNHRRR